MIPEETIQQIAAANDIVEVIGGYFPLKRAGMNFRALCPFHQEKTPSFNVNPGRQSYHCFGCGAGGDVFKFVMAYENIDFPSAARKLAERGGIQIVESEFSIEEDQRSQLRRKLLALHQQAAEWFHHLLLKNQAAQGARDYLKGRGLNIDIARAWKIGYAPDSWDAFGKWSLSQGFTVDELIASGLVTTKDNDGQPGANLKWYDRFRDRVMFPICNEQGEVIAFSGRVLQPDAKAAKYVNSPETPLFTKGNILFGLHKSKRALIDKGFAIVCEGQLDLISAFEAGVQNVIAAQGTAFTGRQAHLLKRYVGEVILCFDADNAGQKAAEKSLAALLAENLPVRVAEMPAGHDPDSMIRHEGPEAFTAQISKAKDFFDYQIDRFAATPDFTNPSARTQFARKMAAWASLITDKTLREAVVNKIATRIEISSGELVKLLPVTKVGSTIAPEIEAHIANLDSTIRNLIFTTLSNMAILDQLRKQDWKSILVEESDCELLVKILSSSIDLQEPSSVATFYRSLSPEDEAKIRRIIEIGITPIVLNMRRIDEATATLEATGIIKYQGTKDSKGRQTQVLVQDIHKIAADSWNSLRMRQINRRVTALQARLRAPGLPFEEIIKLQKEVLDLQKHLTDIARPFSSNKDNS